MEEGVAFVHRRSVRGQRSHGAIFQQVRDVEELGVGESVFLALGCVGRYVVQFAKEGGEAYMPGIVEACVRELEDAVLYLCLSPCPCLWLRIYATFAMAS